ncbi:MAG: PhzF family phenazine biosynthesis protein, partial [Longimicrobiales bacterium]
SGALEANDEARFHTRSGLLTARRSDGWIEMDFPAKIARPVEAPPGLVEALGVRAIAVARNQFDHLVEVSTAGEVTAAEPDMTRLRAAGGRGVILTARSTSGEADFVSRFFAPAVGVDEDPVTGSAHCALAPYWCERLGRSDLVGFQASARGGTVRVRWTGGDRVRLEGQAVTVLRCELIENTEVD